MAPASWPAGKLSLALAAVAIVWSFPVRAFAQAPSPEAQTATNPINHADSSGAQPSTLTGDWGGLRTLLGDEGIYVILGLASGTKPLPTCRAGSGRVRLKRANSISA